MEKALIGCLAFVAAMAPLPISGQQTGVDSLKLEVARLRAQVDSLLALRQSDPAAQPEEEDPIARLRSAAAEAAGQRPAAEGADDEPGAGPQVFSGRQRSLQALNPEISVTGNFFGLVNEDDANADNFVAREFEFSFQSALDPYSRARVYVAHHVEGGDLEAFDGGHAEEEGGHEGTTEVEEGYIQWVNLPGGLGITLGKFRQRLGSYNRWHAHALPGQGYFLPYKTFLGEEGLAQTGAAVHWLAPFGGGTYEASFEVTRSGNANMFGDSNEPSFLGHVNAFWDLSPSTYLELSVSGLTGDFVGDAGERFRNQLLHLEGGLNWRPPSRSINRELNLRGAVMFNDREALPGVSAGESALGAFGLAEFKFHQQWIAGMRYDYVENPLNTAETAWMLAPTLTWWQSEWVRVRAEYDVLDGPLGRVGQFMLQFTFAMGPHKHETY